MSGWGWGTRTPRGSGAGDRLCRNARNAPEAEPAGPAAAALASAFLCPAPAAQPEVTGASSERAVRCTDFSPPLASLHAAEGAAEGKRSSSCVGLQLAFRLGVFAALVSRTVNLGLSGSVAKVIDHCPRFLASLVCKV